MREPKSKNPLVKNRVLAECLSDMRRTRRKQVEQEPEPDLDLDTQTLQVFSDERFVRQARAKLTLVGRYLGMPKGKNVVGVGVGNKITDGVDTGIGSVRVYVSKKLEKDDLTKAARVPADFDDVKTDVVEIDHRLSPFSRVRRPDEIPRREGIGPGSSIGPEVVNVSNRSPNVAGTLGAVLSEERDPRARYILSCNHVLAVQGRVPRGERGKIISPGPDERLPDENGDAGPIAKRSVMVRLEHDGLNTVDCALAEIEAGAGVDGHFPEYEGVFDDEHDDVNEHAYPIEGQQVIKFGKTTGWTKGTIIDVFADVLVDYNFGTFHFSNQVLIQGDDDAFAADGDSGAVVLMLNPRGRPTPVAMVFAPAGSLCVACPMPAVIERLESELSRQPGKNGVKLKFEHARPGPVAAM